MAYSLGMGQMIRFRRRRFYYHNCYGTQEAAIDRARALKQARGCHYQIIPKYGMWELWLSKII